MTEQRLLGRLESVLKVIQSQDFKSPQDKESVHGLHEALTNKLIEMNAGGKVMQLRFEVSRRHSLPFEPKIVNDFPITNSTVGWINGSHGGSSYRVERELLGRTYITTIDKDVVLTEFFQPQGGDQDIPLFTLAQIHNGFKGVEGAVTKIVSRREAEGLLFTGFGEIKKPQETTIFKQNTPQKVLIAA